MAPLAQFVDNLELYRVDDETFRGLELLEGCMMKSRWWEGPPAKPANRRGRLGLLWRSHSTQRPRDTLPLGHRTSHSFTTARLGRSVVLWRVDFSGSNGILNFPQSTEFV